MNKIIPYILIIVGAGLTIFSCYRITTNNKEIEQENKEETENENKEDNKNNQTNNEITKEELTEEDKREIEQYLINKYNEEFEVVELISAFCVEISETNLSYSESCSADKIKNRIYKVKDLNDIVFYVKKVSYDETKITLTKEEYVNTQSIGLYDNYISYIKADEVIKDLEEEYKKIFNAEVKVRIYDGIGIRNIYQPNSYMMLGREMQIITEKNISIGNFVEKLPSFDKELGINIKVNQDITKDNFQQIVKIIKETNFMQKYPILSLDEMMIQFNNENRYIEYNSEGIVYLKQGEEIFEHNNTLYEKAITFNENLSNVGITYEEFLKLDKSNFEF